MSQGDCFRCGEPVLPGEEAQQPVYVMSGHRSAMAEWHRECAIRSVVGSLGHLRGTCSCFGGTVEDPPGMTKRQAARAAMAEWKRQQGSAPKKCS